ncbi:BMC domain-containing protein [Streptococcus cuniculi]|uniref:BMC domain-containing protein n=1 Tax=Streptococcus cuniculi TaxID=1432788 RepID=A0A4Y9JCF6_9STRE|nr:BMC domain-containing protein [Streptococcus cuniculi]MBF0777601.1 BMC domain-containing protein [Streptococcus cuniculi]TFU98642.1 BMC domain-containing protein [Streptococcus cuniculi]
MTKRALGLIEVKGYLGAVVAADAAVKAANVSLLNIETVKAGLNTVQLVGDVSAVKAAVDAAVDAVHDKPYYLASHVIPRLDDQTYILFKAKRNEAKEVEVVEEENTLVEIPQPLDDVRPPQETVELTETAILEIPPVVEEEAVIVQEERGVPKFSREELEKLKVVKLRSIAYREKDIDLSKKEIKFANKHLLIEALMKITRKE